MPIIISKGGFADITKSTMVLGAKLTPVVVFQLLTNYSMCVLQGCPI